MLCIHLFVLSLWMNPNAHQSEDFPAVLLMSFSLPRQVQGTILSPPKLKSVQPASIIQCKNAAHHPSLSVLFITVITILLQLHYKL